MPKDDSEGWEHPFITTVKVHRLLCLELKKFRDKISQIFPAIESARPRCESGIQALCKLHVSMEKTSLLLQHCSESSKLYLAITGDKIQLRCEKIQNSLVSCLSQIQNMVPSKLAVQISRIIDDLKVATFTVEPTEDEAGQALLALLHQDIEAISSANLEELEAFKHAALRLNIASPTAVLIEKRSIRKLLGKIPNTCPKTRMKLFDLSLTPNFALKDLISTWCIENGITVIDPCLYTSSSRRSFPKFSSSRSIASFYSSLEGLQLQVSNVSIRSSDTNNDLDSLDAMNEDGLGCEMNENENFLDYQSSNDRGINLSFLAKLSALPWAARRNAVEDVKSQLNDVKASHSIISTSYIKPLLKFLKDARFFGDSTAQRDGVELLLIFLRELSNVVITSQPPTPSVDSCCANWICMVLNRSEVPPLPKDAFNLFTSFLESEITGEIFAIMELLATQKCYKNDIVASGVLSSILRVLDDPNSDHHLPALKALCNFSVHTEIGYHMIHLGYIPKLAPFLDDLILAGHCIKIFKFLCNSEEAAIEIVNTENCITSIGELLEICANEEQELCLEVLFSICYQHEEFCVVVMTENIINSVFNISIDGDTRAKSIAAEFLQLLEKVKDGHPHECDPDLHPGIVKDSVKILAGKKSSGFFARRMSIFSKPVR